MKAKLTRAVAYVLVLTSCLMLTGFRAEAAMVSAGIQSELMNSSVSNTTANTAVQQTPAPDTTVQAGIEAEAAEPVTEEPVEQPEDIQQPAEPSEWSGRIMAKVNDSLNIRAEANEESSLVGKLFKGGAADIIERGDTWTKIKSGSVEGYVKNEFVAFDDEAKVLAEQEGVLMATVTTETLRIRSEASMEAPVLGLAAREEQMEVLEDQGDWLTILLSKDETGYIAKEFVSTELQLGEAKSMEEIKAEQKAQEEAKKSQQKAPQVTQEAAVNAEADDVTILAALIQLEAGAESYDGKLAVGSVVMNRVRSGGYPSSISGVVYQSGQFPPAHGARMASLIANGPSGSCIQAAQEAISGVNNIGGATQFRPASSGAPGTVIGNQVFW